LKPGISGSTAAAIKFYDGQSHLLSLFESYVGGRDDDDAAFDWKKAIKSLPAKSISYSRESKVLKAHGPNESGQLPPGLIPKLLHPEEFGPCLWMISDIMLGLAEYRKKNLIAVMSDSLWTDSNPEVSLLDEYLWLKTGTRPETVDEDDEWMVVRPKCARA